MNIFRESTVAISASTKWKLTRIVKAQSNGELDVPLNVDALAEQVLSGWIAHNHPKLDECWKKRESADAEAEDSIKNFVTVSSMIRHEDVEGESKRR